jgi:hypothetical protein
MRGIRRLLFVTAVAVVSFVVAIVSFREPPASGCQMDASSDASYQVELEEPPEVGTASYHLQVTRGGRPVTDAWVCVRLAIVGDGGSGEVARSVASEVSPGRYRAAIALTTPGRWRGAVIVSEPGRDRVGVPLDVEVP